jgi:hypothetical protein
MPRQTINPRARGMLTYDVNITKTDEEELYKHLLNKLEDISIIFDEARRRQDAMVDLVFSKNPYENFCWRNRIPKRIEFMDWTKQEEKWYTFMKDLFELKHDLKLCLTIFKWEETRTDGAELEYKLLKLNLDYEDEFKRYENMRYNQSKKEWENRDAEWIKEKKDLETHTVYHHPIEYHVELSKDIDYIKWTFKDGIIKSTEIDTCKHCIKAQEWRAGEPERKRLEEEKERLEEEKLEESYRKLKEEKEEQRKKQLDSRHLYICDLCNYKTYDDESWDSHEDSKSHKKLVELKSLYCKVCEVQSRNPTELSIHKQTKKHKIKCGEIEKQTEFKCEPCNYTTSLKQNYDKHCLSKSHKERM